MKNSKNSPKISYEKREPAREPAPSNVTGLDCYPRLLESPSSFRDDEGWKRAYSFVNPYLGKI